MRAIYMGGLRPPSCDFGRRLWECLEDAQVEIDTPTVSTYLGVSGPQMRKYFYDDEKPRMTAAIALAEKLGVSVDWLLTGRGSKKPGGLSLAVIQAVGAVEQHCAAHDLDLTPEDKLRLVEFLLADTAGREFTVEIGLRKLQALHGLGLSFSHNGDGRVVRESGSKKPR
jgi:hypothetical protein